MLRRSALVVPALAAFAAWLGMRWSERPVVTLGAAVLIGFLAATVLGWVLERRIAAVVDAVERLADGVPVEGRARGSFEWRRLDAALRDAAASIGERFDELTTEQTRVERLLNVLPTAVLLFTDEGLAYANPAARALFDLTDGFGLTPMQALGAAGLVDALGEAKASGSTVEVEVQRDTLLLRARATSTGRDEVALALTDLTASRRVEAMRRDFVTNASHELKTPVAGIQALSESLSMAMDRDPERARAMVQRLQQEALRLNELVRELLDLTRLEEAAREDQWAPVDLAGMVRRSIDRLEPLTKARGITVRAEIEEGATVIGVALDLRLIVGNLLDNAVRYNRDGGSVGVRLERSGAEVVFEVTDSGVGISEEHRERVFERFYRVDPGRSRQAGGTGLGLSIVRNAVQRHGGRVEVDSILGQGTTFRVHLRVDAAPR